MSTHTWTQEAECDACEGTGLYVGIAERDAAAVVCSSCKGSGCREIVVRWKAFGGRKRRKGVRRVVQTNPGICVGEGHGHTLEDFGGLPYDDWERGESFGTGTEMRRFTCPAWWYQTADYSKKPDWKECGWGAFSSCAHFCLKDECWARFDREQGVQP